MLINKGFKLRIEQDTLNMICISDMSRPVTNFNVELQKPIENRYYIKCTSDIDRELMDSFIYDNYYCSNMNSYIFAISDCSAELIESFYTEFIKFIIQYNINPADFHYVICEDSNISDDMRVKLSKINTIQFMDYDYGAW